MKLPRQSRVSLHVLSTQATPGAFRVRHASRKLQPGELSPGTSRARHVSRKPKPRATLRMSPELSTCPGSLTPRENPSRCIPSVTRVPSAQTGKIPPDAFRVCHVSQVPKPRATPSELLRSVPRVSKPRRETPSELLRSMPRVPKPTPRDPFGAPLERATCPEAHTKRSLRIPSECDTCPEWLKPF